MNDLKSMLKENGFVFPDYKKSNMSVLTDMISKHPYSGDKKKKIFLVVDGLGYNLVENLLISDSKTEGLLGNAKVEKKSTIFPSTTTAVITSFETGRTPAEHGLIGWDVYYKELGLIVTPYRDSAALSRSIKLSSNGIENTFPKPQTFINALNKGNVLMLYPEDIGNVSTANMKGFTHERYYGSTDLFVHLKNAIRRNREWFVYAYYRGPDPLEHLYGFTSDQVKNWVFSFFSELNRIVLPILDGSDYELIITSDHGQVELNKNIHLAPESDIMQYLAMPPWGDMRVLCMNALPGKEDALMKQFDKDYGNDAVLVDSESLIRTGIFGKTIVRADVRPRFGTHFALVKGHVSMHYEYPLFGNKKKHYNPKGTHSGLSKYEMEVPVITYS